jgi:hypothetical protein
MPCDSEIHVLYTFFEAMNYVFSMNVQFDQISKAPHSLNDFIYFKCNFFPEGLYYYLESYKIVSHWL